MPADTTGKPSDEPAARIPVPAPRVVLTAEDREAWAPAPPDGAVPVLLYHGGAPDDFARHMTLLDHAGYDTITLDAFIRFIRREQVRLPPRPLLLTFDGGRLDSWTGSDAILRKLGFSAVLFVDVGRGFEVVLTQDRRRFASPGAVNPLGRIEVTRDVGEEELHALLQR